MNKPINIIFDGPPNNDSGRFVEVETDDGKGIKVGEWIQKGNYWALRITELPKEQQTEPKDTAPPLSDSDEPQMEETEGEELPPSPLIAQGSVK